MIMKEQHGRLLLRVLETTQNFYSVGSTGSLVSPREE